MATRRPSRSTLIVLSRVMQSPVHGYGLMKDTGLKSGSLYPILMRLRDRGLVSARSEASDVSGRPARQIYAITQDGLQYLREFGQLPGPLPDTGSLGAPA